MMTFSTVPRSKNPVLSFQTQSHDAETLRAEIQAARTQQQKFRSRHSRYFIEPTIEEEEMSDPFACEHSSTPSPPRLKPSKPYVQRSARQSLSSSMRSISGTVKGELNTAKRFLKDTSFRRFHRIVRRPSTSSDQTHDGDGFKEDSILGTGIFASPQSIEESTMFNSTEPAELSSDPLYQLEDNSRASSQFEEFSIPSSFFPAPNTDSRWRSRSTSPGPKSGSLSSKSYSCDNCQQPICGGDLYDFCVMCSPSDRILCIVCARQRKCWRHQTDATSIEKLSSARYSPAPPYSRPDEGEQPLNRLDYSSRHAADYTDRVIPQNVNVDTSNLGSHDHSPINPDSHKDLLDIINRLVSIQVSEKERNDKSCQSKEIVLREQYAALREERTAVKEQELLLREREHLSRERDAVVIRNLQTLVAVQELSKNSYSGSHNPRFYRDHLQSNQNVRANKMPMSFQGGAEANFHDTSDQKSTVHATPENQECDINNNVDIFEDASLNIRTRQGGKRKQSQMYSTENQSSGQQHTIPQGKGRSPARPDPSSGEQDENSEDENVTPPKKQKHGLTEHDLPQRIFACPYYKNDPTRYSPRNLSEKHYRGCSGHFLHDIPRLKQHLRRVHWRPEHHCPRCFKVFTEPGQLAEHFEQTVACSRQECPFPEKMDKVQRQQIHVKRPKVSPETLWYDIYKVLFPGTPLPESPYAEDENVTPPVSAVSNSPLSEEVTQRMVKLFNDRLDKHKNRPGHDWISSSTTRHLINAAMSESLNELFGGLSLTVISPTEPCASVTASSTSSPVTPPPASYPVPVTMNEARDERAVTQRSDPVLTTAVSSITHTPILRSPKRTLNPALSDPNKARILQSLQAGENTGPGMSLPYETSDNNSEYGIQEPSVQGIHEEVVEDMVYQRNGTGYDFPDVMPVDIGWDEQSNSYSKGDDLKAMELDFQMSSRLADEQAYGHLQTPRPIKPRKRLNNFVPVRLETLEDIVPSEISRPGPLQSSKSIASLVDSGYGSGNSEHSIVRTQHYEKESNIILDGNDSGHRTFDEELELMQNIDDSLNPWRTEDYWAR